jgi:nuclear pore complex protein Nup205
MPLTPLSENLNPLYIFESKMSLMSRMAQTRGGAERLTENCLILYLAKSDFIDARPESDQAFVGEHTMIL